MGALGGGDKDEGKKPVVAKATREQTQAEVNIALEKLTPQAAAEGESLGTIKGPSLQAIKSHSIIQPLVAKPEKDAAGVGVVGLASQNMLWARQLALTAYKTKEAARAITKQATAAMAIADNAAVQVGYIMNHPCLRLSEEGEDAHSKAVEAAMLANTRKEEQSDLAATEAQATVTPRVASMLPVNVADPVVAAVVAAVSVSAQSVVNQLSSGRERSRRYSTCHLASSSDFL